jgi:glycosyltransferase involved in cell wall biosynthesis
MKKKIFVIGPIMPFTGGIAHSNTVLCSNLAKNNDVTAISYSMMFPKLFYPGKSQKSGNRIKTKFKQKFILNTLNPIFWIKIVSMIKKEKPEWVVFQWWHTYFFPSYYFISFFAKIVSRSTKLNIICHNVLPHEESIVMKLIHRPLTKLMLRKTNKITALSESELKVAKSLAPRTKANFILENFYGEIIKGKKVSALMARTKLKLPNKKIILSFGAVRQYKGVDDLLEAFALLKNKNDYFLVVAGAFWDPVEKYIALAKKLEIEKNVLFVDKYIPDDEVPLYFGVADLLVLSHRTATQSAIPQLAYLYNVPMVATMAPGNIPFVDDNENGFLVPVKNPEEMSMAIQKFFDKRLSLKFKKGIRKKMKEFVWDDKKEECLFN